MLCWYFGMLIWTGCSLKVIIMTQLVYCYFHFSFIIASEKKVHFLGTDFMYVLLILMSFFFTFDFACVQW